MLHDFNQALLQHTAFLRGMFKAFFQLAGLTFMSGSKLLKPCSFTLQLGTKPKHMRYFFLQLFKRRVLHGKYLHKKNKSPEAH